MKVLIDDKIQDYPAEDIAQWTAELPQWRREKVEAIKHDAGRRQSLLAYRLLCQGLREEYGIMEPPTFEYGEHGKPYIAPLPAPPVGRRAANAPTVIRGRESLPPTGGDGEGLYFSLSHCREAVACVIDEHPCGIDIESVGRKISDSLIRYSMNEEEQQEIASPPPHGGSGERGLVFLRLWTRKEAVLKLIGTGIRDTMKNVLVDCPYHIETRETERWVMSVATIS